MASPRKRRAERKQRAWFKAYGSEGYVRYIKALPCVGCGAQPCEASHVRSRGAGGRWWQIVPMCYVCHHQVWHGINAGRLTFCKRFAWTMERLFAHALELARNGAHLVTDTAVAGSPP